MFLHLVFRRSLATRKQVFSAFPGIALKKFSLGGCPALSTGLCRGQARRCRAPDSHQGGHALTPLRKNFFECQTGPLRADIWYIETVKYYTPPRNNNFYLHQFHLKNKWFKFPLLNFYDSSFWKKLLRFEIFSFHSNHLCWLDVMAFRFIVHFQTSADTLELLITKTCKQKAANWWALEERVLPQRAEEQIKKRTLEIDYILILFFFLFFFFLREVDLQFCLLGGT